MSSVLRGFPGKLLHLRNVTLGGKEEEVGVLKRIWLIDVLGTFVTLMGSVRRSTKNDRGRPFTEANV